MSADALVRHAPVLAPLLAALGFGGAAWVLLARALERPTILSLTRPRDLRPLAGRVRALAGRLFPAELVAERLERAGRPWGLTAEAWALVRLAALAVAPLLGLSIAGPPGLAAGAAAGWFGPDFVLDQLTDDRRRRIAARVPLVADLTAAAMSAGVPTVAAALERATGREHDLDRVLRAALDEAGALGFEAAMHRAAARALAEEARVLCATLAQAHALGAGAAEYLRQQARQIHQMRAAARKAQAERAKVWVLLVTVVFAFVPLFVLVLAPAWGTMKAIFTM